MGLGHEAAIRGGLGSGLDGIQHLADISLLLLQQVLYSHPKPRCGIPFPASAAGLPQSLDLQIKQIILLIIQWASFKKELNFLLPYCIIYMGIFSS